MLDAIRVPKHTGWGAHYEKFVRVSHQWSIVAVAATVRVDGGTITEARIGADQHGVDPAARRAVEQALVGQPATDEAVRDAAAARRRRHQPAVRPQRRRRLPQHLATVLTRRAVLAAPEPDARWS